MYKRFRDEYSAFSVEAINPDCFEIEWPEAWHAGHTQEYTLSELEELKAVIQAAIDDGMTRPIDAEFHKAADEGESK